VLRIIDRYVLKECTLATLGVITVLLFILLGNTLVRVLGDVAEGKLPSDSLWPMLSINLVHYLVVLVPMGLYLGILFGIGRLYKDSEMAALFACGIGPRGLYRAILALALPLAVFAIALSMYLAPWTVGKQDEIKHQARHQSRLHGLAPGQFNSAGNGKQTLFFEAVSGENERMQQVFLQTLDEDRAGELRTVAVAESALRRQDGWDAYLEFYNGVSYSGTPGQTDYSVTEFATQGVRIQQSDTPALNLRTSATPTRELFRDSTPQSRAEWHWRLAIPTACLLLALLALPLSYAPPRKGRFAKLGAGILVYIIYTNLLGIGRVWLERDMSPGWLGLWWVHSIMLGFILILLFKHERAGFFVWPRKITTHGVA
jgi:lipopolysaccharide export system permease protein